MAWIGGSAGIFRLHDSDNFCGSKIATQDVAQIFDITLADVRSLKQHGVRIIHEGDEEFIAEIDLHRAWAKGVIPTQHPPKIGSAKRSLDELILMKLIKVVLPKSTVEPQAKCGRKQIDLTVKHDAKNVAIEFVGPSHFIPDYGRTPKSPLDRKMEVEQALGFECVIWPYWIQRSESNVKALFDATIRGIASVWSTKAHFGDFYFDDSADLILRITSRFNAVDEQGIGYMYTNQRTPNKPIHPIVRRVQEGTESVSRLIPKGSKAPQGF